MTVLANNLSQEEFFLLHVSEYLGGNLSETNEKTFNQILEQEEFKKKLELYKKKIGVFQLYLQEHTISQSDEELLINKMRPKEASDVLEKVKIDALSIREEKMKKFRVFSFIAFPSLLVFILWKVFAPPPPPDFDPLQSLAYETTAMYNKSISAYLDFPSQNREEIIEYLQHNRLITFEPLVFKMTDDSLWQEVGSTVIDYEVAKIVLVQYQLKNSDQSIYLYSYKGDIRYLPQDEPGSLEQLNYLSFGSDQINLIAWQSSPETVAILTGWLSIEDLAKIAVSGTSI